MNQITTMNQDQIARASTAELKKALTQGLTISAKQLNYLAKLWRELEQRGEDLSALRSGLGTYLPLIADSKLDPEAVVRFAGQKTMLEQLMTLPLAEQRRLLDADSVPLVVLAEDGTPQAKPTPLTKLSRTQIRQVFEQGKIRSEQEQTALLQCHKSSKKERATLSKITINEKAGYIKIGDRLTELDDLLLALKKAGYTVRK